jgi:hypothetical protein
VFRLANLQGENRVLILAWTPRSRDTVPTSISKNDDGYRYDAR